MIVPHGNLGYYPAAVFDRAGEVQELIHYSFASFNLVRSVRQLGGQWQSTAFGFQGDGLGFVMRQDRRGQLHFLFASHRFNGDPKRGMYRRWDGQQWSHQVIDASASSIFGLELLSDGTPVIQRETTLMRRRGETWVEFCRLPAAANLFREQWLIKPEGHVLCPSWDGSARRLVLFERTAVEWSGAVVAERSEAEDDPQCLGPAAGRPRPAADPPRTGRGTERLVDRRAAKPGPLTALGR